MKKMISLLLALAMILAMTACGSAPAEDNTTAPAETTAEPTTEAGIYTPGNYTAQAQGYQSVVTVSVTVDANNIIDVQLDVSGETPGIGAASGDKLVKKILDAQSAEFDVISSTTYTSKGVQAALEECLKLAMSVADTPAAG